MGCYNFWGLSSQMMSSVGLSSWMLFRGCPSVMLLFRILSLVGLSSRMISEGSYLGCYLDGVVIWDVIIGWIIIWYAI